MEEARIKEGPAPSQQAPCLAVRRKIREITTEFALLPAPELGKDCDAAQALQGSGRLEANFAYLHPPVIHASVPRAAAQFPRLPSAMIMRTCALGPVFLGSVLLVGSSLGGCKRNTEPSEGTAPPPPPVVSSQPGVCASGGGTVKDSVSSSYFPRTAGDYCLDPNAEAKTFGENAASPLDGVCDLFDGECEIYKGFGLKRVVTTQYVDGKGSPGSVSVTLSRFASPEAAYAFFTKRVVADADPLEASPAPLDAGAAGALGTGMAYVWKGEMVAELRYVHELESPDQIKVSGARVLPLIARSLGAQLPGEPRQLPSVARLPAEQRIASGIAYEYRDLLGVSGAGRGAIGYYQDGKRRYRVFASVRADEESAKDVTKTLRKLEGARGIKDSPIDALSLGLRESEGEPKVEWVVGRSGNLVMGVGDEVFALANAGADSAAVRLSEAEKLEKLRTLLAAAPAPGPNATAPAAAPSASAR
jgi:hypothetical protein